VNTDWNNTSGDVVSDYTYLLEVDYDPGAGTDFLAWDQISSPTAPIPFTVPANPGFYDHSFGTNGTANGAGTEAANSSQYATLVAANNVVQNSWRHTFFDQPPFAFDATSIGRYDIRLTVFDGVTVAAQTGIQIKVVKSATCTVNADCDDGLACNGVETCDTATSECQFGNAVVCSGACETGICLEPGVCQPKVNGTVCTATPDTCSIDDTCQAGVCVDGGGGDSDSDTVCDADDNCPDDANTSQADADGDDLGDVCDPADGIHHLTRLSVRRQRAPGANNGAIRMAGDFITPPDFVFPPITVRVTDNLNLDETHTLTACQGTGGGLRCTETVGGVRLKARFKPIRSTPSVWRYRISINRIGIDAPFSPPLSVTLTHDSVIDRVDGIGDCRQLSSGVNCREF
jgi:hypothetical protein